MPAGEEIPCIKFLAQEGIVLIQLVVALTGLPPGPWVEAMFGYLASNLVASSV
jgi:hypothetical protein